VRGNLSNPIANRVNRESFVDPNINPEHWVGKWERGEISSDEDARSAATAIKRSGFHTANKRYSSFVTEHLGGE
jgi:hypothetical protein